MSKWGVALVVVVLLVAAGCAVAWRPALAPVQGGGSFPSDQIARGAELAAIGDCAVCHTAAGGPAFAGGRGVGTPFGVIYATNITPDPETGLGGWSLAAFQRAMRDGIDREGRHLYPVLPYPHFTRATDDDIAAMYAFLMTRAPVHSVAPRNHLPFPLNQRAVLAGWNLLYLKPGPWKPDPAHDASWNRGAYLVEAVGHCGACHTPHNVLGAERDSKALSGGDVDDSYAPPLQAGSPAGRPWTAEALEDYLRTGFSAQHGAAAGPMTDVTEELSRVPASEVRAIANYVASMMPQSSSGMVTAHGASDPVFAGACGGCHGADAPMTRAGAPSLAMSSLVNAPTPAGVVQMILHGIPWRAGQTGPYMPSFASELTDEQVAELAAYLRSTYTEKPAWTDIPATVQKARRTT